MPVGRMIDDEYAICSALILRHESGCSTSGDLTSTAAGSTIWTARQAENVLVGLDCNQIP